MAEVVYIKIAMKILEPSTSISEPNTLDIDDLS